MLLIVHDSDGHSISRTLIADIMSLFQVSFSPDHSLSSATRVLRTHPSSSLGHAWPASVHEVFAPKRIEPRVRRRSIELRVPVQLEDAFIEALSLVPGRLAR